MIRPSGPGVGVGNAVSCSSGADMGLRAEDHPWAAADAWGLGRPCPFGGIVKVEGFFYWGYYYRVKVHRVGDPPGTFTVLADAMAALVEADSVTPDEGS